VTIQRETEQRSENLFFTREIAVWQSLAGKKQQQRLAIDGYQGWKQGEQAETAVVEVAIGKDGSGETRFSISKRELARLVS